MLLPPSAAAIGIATWLLCFLYMWLVNLDDGTSEKDAQMATYRNVYDATMLFLLMLTFLFMFQFLFIYVVVDKSTTTAGTATAIASSWLNQAMLTSIFTVTVFIYVLAFFVKLVFPPPKVYKKRRLYFRGLNQFVYIMMLVSMFCVVIGQYIIRNYM